MYDQKFMKPPEIPYIREAEEVRRAVETGIDMSVGTNSLEQAEASYDVGGVLLPRPFKITGIGPVRLFTDNMEETLAFYMDRLGFVVTESIDWNGEACHFLRCGNDHHALALYPMGLRAELGLTDWSSNFSFGVRMNDYQQLKAATAWLAEQGADIYYFPPELFPGMDYTAFAIDPDGHAIQLYYYMEQIGWDGRPRPADQRPLIDNDNWPETLEPCSDSFAGEQFMGPWG